MSVTVEFPDNFPITALARIAAEQGFVLKAKRFDKYFCEESPAYSNVKAFPRAASRKPNDEPPRPAA